MYDAIVIGGGPAGLQAALTLGRIHRTVLLVDSGEYRNAPAGHLHNLIGFDGTSPADLRAAARRDLAEYATVELREAVVTGVDGESGDLSVAFADGRREAARAVVVAVGVRDELPDVPGLAEEWGRRVAHCPFCHGHEFAGQRVGILAPDESRLAHLTGLMRPVTEDLVPVTGLTRVESLDEGLRLHLDDGRTLDVAGLYVSPAIAPSPIVAALGVDTSSSGMILTDAMGRTSRPGVYAAGDVAHLAVQAGPMQSIPNAIAAGAVAATAAAADAFAHH